MSDILVMYHSLSGNTERVARAVAKGCKGDIRSVDKAPASFGNYELVIIGTPVHGGKPSAQMRSFLKNFKRKGKLAFFCTWGVPVWGPPSVERNFKFLSENTKGPVLGMFECRGMHKVVRTCRGHPNAKDLKAARAWGNSLVKKLRDAEPL